MSIKRLVTDYTGRKKDLHIVFKIDPSLATTQKMDFRFGNVSSFCAGTQKLLQRYVINLFTAVESQPNFPQFGTNLLPKLLNGKFVGLSDVTHILNFANWKVVSEFRAYQRANPALPLDEQLNTASVTNVALDRGKISIKISILTLAGEAIDFLLPLPIIK